MSNVAVVLVLAVVPVVLVAAAVTEVYATVVAFGGLDSFFFNSGGEVVIAADDDARIEQIMSDGDLILIALELADLSPVDTSNAPRPLSSTTPCCSTTLASVSSGR